jgi:hypothetical protein
MRVLIGKLEVEAARITVTSKQVLKLHMLFGCNFALEFGVNE